jgi:hypothetical protein
MLRNLTNAPKQRNEGYNSSFVVEQATVDRLTAGRRDKRKYCSFANADISNE